MNDKTPEINNEAPDPRTKTPGAIPEVIIKEGIRQAEAGAHFYGKPLAEMTREELYGAVCVAWFDSSEIRKYARALQQKLVDAGLMTTEPADEKGSDDA